MGLSQTLPVTSYFKMIDIWMLFTMTVPFLELVFHTSNEVFKKSRATHPCLNKQVDVVNVEPAEDQEVGEEVKTDNNIINLMASLLLPLCSLIFALIFCTVGLIASYSDGNNMHHSMTECLTVHPL